MLYINKGLVIHEKNIHGCEENHQSKKSKKENIIYAKQLQ